MSFFSEGRAYLLVAGWLLGSTDELGSAAPQWFLWLFGGLSLLFAVVAHVTKDHPHDTRRPR